MSRKLCLKFLVPAAFTFLSLQLNAQSIDPYKDELFSNSKRQVLESRNNGSWKRYHWDEIEDVNGRDAIPGQTAKPERVDLSVNSQQRTVLVPFAGGKLDTYEVGDPKNAKFAVIYIHGADGSKDQGTNDLSFGGNFNRLKNLAAKNKGVYYSPTVTFDDAGNRGVVALISKIRKASPNAKIVIACGSAGAYTCWQMSDLATKDLSGIVLVGGAREHQNIGQSAAVLNNVPMIFSHGTNDRLVDWHMLQSQYDDVLKVKPNYPVRLELFEGGKHGTPIRNIDWRESLLWIFDHAPAGPPDRKDRPVKTGKGSPASS